MSSGEHPLMSRSTETPLDLTVKRLDMNDHPSDMQQYPYDRYPPYVGNPNDIVQMSPSEYGYQQYPHTSAPDNGYQYNNNGYCVDVGYTARPAYTHTQLPIPNTSFTSQTGSYNPNIGCQQETEGLEGLDTFHSYGSTSHSPSNESSIIPKKRKNLWRPYDSKLAQAHDTDKESDSGSESTSGSCSDQEFKTPSPPTDPVKKRKMHRSHNNKESNSIDTPVKSSNFDCPDGAVQHRPVNPMGVAERNGDWYVSPPVGNLDRKRPSPSTSPNVHQSHSAPRSADKRDKLIAGMKKRDIFGWSLKLKNPAVTEDVIPITKTDTSQTEAQRVCTDGEKTYFELQTVRKSSPEPTVVPTMNGDSVPVRSQHGTSIPPSATNDNVNAAVKDNSVTEPSGVDIDVKENKDSDNNYVGKKVFIQRKDNIIECCNEAESNTKVTTETKKRLSLIDLVEEIEAPARDKDKEEAEKAHQRNRNIAKLLDQCNYVKLQALDYLMANVLIQDKQHQFKSKNETVQKMLKGDKINSISMLDVVELQVEIGLN